MKSTLHPLLFLLCAILFAGCAQLEVVSPDDWQKQKFERSVRNSVRKAVQTPGIDNGTTIVLTSKGDTLIAPSDSALRAIPNRTVYIEIESPEYPKGVSSYFVNMMTVSAICSIVGLIILIALIMVFVTVTRRQGSRNKIISQAIESNYTLPDAFYTGQPSPAPINVTQTYRETTTDCGGTSIPPRFPQQNPLEDNAIPINFGDALKAARNLTQSEKKQLTHAFIMIGLGVVVFISFAAANAPEAGFCIGGTLVVFGLAKFLTFFLSKKY